MRDDDERAILEAPRDFVGLPTSCGIDLSDQFYLWGIPTSRAIQPLGRSQPPGMFNPLAVPTLGSVQSQSYSRQLEGKALYKASH